MPATKGIDAQAKSKMLNKKEKVAFIGKKLDELYPNPPIPLNYTNAFTMLVAVVLSAQCTDIRVNQVTAVLFKKADTPQKMLKLGVDGIAEIIKPCGFFNTKSANIFKLSQALIKEFDGSVPQTFEELESLPGVGHKTASVIMSHIFKQPAFPVDTHIHRLAERWGLSDGSSVEKTEADLKKVFPPEEWEKRHLQIIYFGRNECKARGHKAENCPICSAVGCK